ncbi:NmrA-like domain-containing protein, partial [Mycena maculata]
LLKDGTFVPRAITRDPTGEAAKKLQESGVEVVKGDSLDKRSLVDALRRSMRYVNLIPAWKQIDNVPIFPMKAEGEGPNEIVQGKNIVDPAKEVGVKFFILSSLPSINTISGGKYTKALHYDHKQVVEGYLKSSGLANASLHLGGFLEN